jgi:hypothetical protein
LSRSLTFIARQNERLIVCGDFNLAGVDKFTIDSQLSALLDMYGYVQHVTEPTRHDPKGKSAMNE